MRDYYTIGEVAYLLKVSRSTVGRWIREGKLKAFITNGVTKDEWNFNDRVSNSVKKHLCYGIKPESLDELVFDMPVGIMEAFIIRSEQKDLAECMSMLDKREQDLCNELETISRIKSYIRKEIEPYN